MSSTATTPATAATATLTGDTRTASASAVRAPRALVRRLLATLALMLAMTAVIGLTSGTASAAPSANATVDVCFRHSGGGAYQNTVFAQKWNSAAQDWQQIGSFSGSRNGCSRWIVAPGQYVRFEAFYQMGQRSWRGVSTHKWIQSGYYYHYGTWLVFPY